MNITVIGAGITGITTAYYLAKANFAVTVIDEREMPGMATSYANGGQLSASNAEVWNSWRSVQKGIKWVLKKDAPLLINPKPSLEKYQWLAKFLTHIKDREHNTRETCEMAISAHALYKQIAEEEGIEFDRVDKGILHIYRDARELEFARDTNRVYREAGLNRWEVGKDEILSIEPTLKNSIGTIVGGFYNEQDYTGDIHKFCVNLMKVMQRKYRVQFVQRRLERFAIFQYLEKGPVVVCAGVGSRAIAKDVGDHLPIYPVKGYSITVDLDAASAEAAPWTSLLDDQTKIVSSRLGKDRFRIAGTAELNGYNTDIVQERIRPLKKWVRDLFPEVSLEDVKPWAGLRPMTPNMMPIVKRSDRNWGVWYNTGHGHLGWTLSAFTAKQIAEQIRKS